MTTTLADIPVVIRPRISTGFTGLDRVLGNGGMVPGTVIALIGAPGVGKTALIAGIAGRVPDALYAVLCASAVDAERTMRLAAMYHNGHPPAIHALRAPRIVGEARERKSRVVLVDEFPWHRQHMREDELDTLVRNTRANERAYVLAIHANKTLRARPSPLLEHAVDVVLRISRLGDRGVVLCTKNRRGPDDVKWTAGYVEKRGWYDVEAL